MNRSVHAAFQAYVEQVLMPTLTPDDSVILDNPAYRRLVTIVSGITDVSFGSGSDFLNTCPERLLLAVKRSSGVRFQRRENHLVIAFRRTAAFWVE